MAPELPDAWGSAGFVQLASHLVPKGAAPDMTFEPWDRKSFRTASTADLVVAVMSSESPVSLIFTVSDTAPPMFSNG
jgi:hypothetical protein